MLHAAAVGFLLVLAIAGAATAQDDATGRYQFAPAGDATLRLDTVTGEIQRCASTPDGSARCTTLATEPRPDGDEVAALEARIAELEARIAELEGSSDADFPDNEAMDRVLLLSERMMRRFFSLLREMQEEGEEL